MHPDLSKLEADVLWNTVVHVCSTRDMVQKAAGGMYKLCMLLDRYLTSLSSVLSLVSVGATATLLMTFICLEVPISDTTGLVKRGMTPVLLTLPRLHMTERKTYLFLQINSVWKNVAETICSLKKDQYFLIFLAARYNCVANYGWWAMSKSGGYNFSIVYFMGVCPCCPSFPLTWMRGGSEPLGTMRTEATFHRHQKTREARS